MKNKTIKIYDSTLRDGAQTKGVSFSIDDKLRILDILMDICRKYPEISNTNRITWEYVMLKGVNDTNEHAKLLAKLIKGIPSKVNLIPFNPWDNSPYECSEPEQIQNFAKILLKNKIPAPIRKTRGEDIMAACGQLKSESERIGKWQKK